MGNASRVDEFRVKLQRLMPRLAKEFDVESLALFGSYVRAEQGPDSDLDVLVTFRATPDLFAIVRLEELLEEALGVPVDLVMRDALRPHIGKRIEAEAQPV